MTKRTALITAWLATLLAAIAIAALLRRAQLHVMIVVNDADTIRVLSDTHIIPIPGVASASEQAP